MFLSLAANCFWNEHKKVFLFGLKKKFLMTKYLKTSLDSIFLFWWRNTLKQSWKSSRWPNKVKALVLLKNWNCFKKGKLTQSNQLNHSLFLNLRPKGSLLEPNMEGPRRGLPGTYSLPTWYLFFTYLVPTRFLPGTCLERTYLSTQATHTAMFLFSKRRANSCSPLLFVGGL